MNYYFLKLFGIPLTTSPFHETKGNSIVYPLMVTSKEYKTGILNYTPPEEIIPMLYSSTDLSTMDANYNPVEDYNENSKVAEANIPYLHAELLTKGKINSDRLEVVKAPLSSSSSVIELPSGVSGSLITPMCFCELRNNSKQITAQSFLNALRDYCNISYDATNRPYKSWIYAMIGNTITKVYIAIPTTNIHTTYADQTNEIYYIDSSNNIYQQSASVPINPNGLMNITAVSTTIDINTLGYMYYKDPISFKSPIDKTLTFYLWRNGKNSLFLTKGSVSNSDNNKKITYSLDGIRGIYVLNDNPITVASGDTDKFTYNGQVYFLGVTRPFFPNKNMGNAQVASGSTDLDGYTIVKKEATATGDNGTYFQIGIKNAGSAQQTEKTIGPGILLSGTWR